MIDVKNNNAYFEKIQGSLIEKEVEDLFCEFLSVRYDEEGEPVVDHNGIDSIILELFTNYDITPKVDNETGDLS
jgi:hypothetical protein